MIMSVKDTLRNIASEKRILAAIRATAREKGKSKLSVREIDQEIRLYRREQQLKRSAPSSTKT